MATSMRPRLVLLAALAGVGALVAEVEAGRPRPPDDPARVLGTWDYRTRSNCGSVEGVGEVAFAWNPAEGGYDERGFVHWADSGRTIRWWGVVRFDPERRRLVGRMRNTLGDDVDAHWELEGPGPDQLVVRWTQTNGCTGVGTATRRTP